MTRAVIGQNILQSAVTIHNIMTGVQEDNIQIDGIQKTNLGPISGDEEPEIFSEGVIGGPVSDEFRDALHFSSLLHNEGTDGE